MKKLTIITIFFLMILIGCAGINPVKFKGPNARDAYSMLCSGMGRTWDKCYVKAGEVCPNGYDIIDQRSSTVAIPTGSGMIAAPKQNLAIECKD